MMAIYPPSTRTVTATFTRDDAPSDPDVVTAHYRNGTDDPVTLLFGTDPELVNPSVGVYSFDVDCTESGTWRAKVEAEWDDEIGGPTYKAFEQHWIVAPSRFPTDES